MCDGQDNDCDGELDEGPDGGEPVAPGPCATGLPGVCAVGHLACLDGAVVCVPDGDAELEICDHLDNDCDGRIDEELLNACGTCGGEPIEACDAVDNDCDGEIDEAESVTWYADEDGDGYGDPAAWVEACAAPDGYTRDDQDCDDTTAEAAPGAAEVCDEIDNDCDGEVDEEMQASSAQSAHRRSAAGRQSRRNAPLCSVRAHVLLVLRPERNTFESSPLLGC